MKSKGKPKLGASTYCTVLPSPYTLHPTPYTLNPAPSTLHPQPCTLNPTPSTLHPQSYTFNPTPSALHPTPSTLHSQPYTINPTPSAEHPQPCTLNPTPLTLHPQLGGGSWRGCRSCAPSRTRAARGRYISRPSKGLCLSKGFSGVRLKGFQYKSWYFKTLQARNASTCGTNQGNGKSAFDPTLRASVVCPLEDQGCAWSVRLLYFGKCPSKGFPVQILAFEKRIRTNMRSCAPSRTRAARGRCVS